MASHRRVPLMFDRRTPREMVERARGFADAMIGRRSVREFSPEPFPDQILLDAIRAAASAPSGAHQQPWTFVVVTDHELERRIREAAEAEEKKSWEHRMRARWAS